MKLMLGEINDVVNGLKTNPINLQLIDDEPDEITMKCFNSGIAITGQIHWFDYLDLTVYPLRSRGRDTLAYQGHLTGEELVIQIHEALRLAGIKNIQFFVVSMSNPDAPPFLMKLHA